uniref:non-specific serine/threonine protein kinase n=1 Tax=Arcella intermedia TaxID=1963864 RepID=A0A6B2L3E5_9EUKA
MELVGGGELFDYIVQKKAIPEMEAVSVIAQVLKAIQYMHSVGIAHRDLKPENLLFKEKDFKVIKIADFGESKKFSGKNLNTYCGTPDYMAPEIIKGDPYGPEVDIWSIGAITYVMLGGFPPFDGENDVEVFASILAVKYSFPAPEWTNISDDAKDFIASIFVGADDRLTAEGCLNHRWIRNNVPAELLVNTTTPPVQAGKPAIDMHKSNPEIKKEETTPENSVVETKEEGALERVPSLVISGEEEKNSIEDSQKKKKKKYAASLEEDLREPKVRLLEGINELLKSSLTAENPLLGGELKAMLIVVTAASGEITNDFENLIFKTYLDRLKELNGLTRKSSGKVPMSARAPGSAHKKKKDKK